MESGVRPNDPSGSLPTQDILQFYDNFQHQKCQEIISSHWRTPPSPASVWADECIRVGWHCREGWGHKPHRHQALSKRLSLCQQPLFEQEVGLGIFRVAFHPGSFEESRKIAAKLCLAVVSYLRMLSWKRRSEDKTGYVANTRTPFPVCST